ncbi:dephospho-CoA kinase [Clostridium septicum]|uniref:Dephospho-CoA kinase n=1 Tax=Clostridium septicum TaxID=1504 RepID=A0A9N7PK96_CLOSE|nr:dephospho-CoA kinase [Clostridium septicum]AYE35400.1 dephospho-CoA kinase [Clostridium septicum]MDU1314373.1 dephospho-CoA kinase [Clostridium septicum]QAS62185.1 dephospho-CoA kinase [Clostridium septicum]UEC22314.1 dephospho-CoA kinase [Clostridium septicum]USS02455.1 dephospho-CoA kinase [Clostridium septicum]
MIKVGLTGGIGSGKSTVSKMLIEKGFPIIDADVISQDVLKKYPEILEKVKIEFGSGFFDWRGEFRRREFGNHIFRFPKQRKKYEEIIIPYIKKEILEALNEHEKKGSKIVILDAPTLIENNLQNNMDFVILVWVDGNTQIQRIKNRDKLGREEAINRINAQMSLEKKKEFASIILDNNGDLLNTKNQVEGLVEFFKEIC